MKEVEVKVIDIDKEGMERKLRSLGGRKVFEGEVLSVHFDTPEGDISRRKDLLRLRRMGGASFLTYKRFIEDGAAKSREEVEVNVSSHDAAAHILASIGLVAIQRMRKTRISYDVDGARVELDKYLDDLEHIPWFMEIEGKDMGHISTVCERLGIDPGSLKAWSFFELIEHYSKSI